MRDGRDEFFVGYLPTPPRLRRFLRRAGVVVLLMGLGAAGVIAARQRDPGTGVWDLANRKEFIGRVAPRPYPMLELQDGAGTLVLVGVGKFSAYLSREAQGRTVRAHGTTLQRSNLRLLEVEGELEPLEVESSAFEESSDPSPITLRGEIIDPKCFAGAMKPGDGKAHKACAALCLRGGIPPALRARAVDGSDVIYLLAAADGGPITGTQLERVIARVGDAVELTGVIVTRGDVRFLRLTSDP